MRLSSYTLIGLLLLSAIGCSEEEPAKTCDTNATMINKASSNSVFCMEASRFQHTIDKFNAEHPETYYTYVDQVGLNFEIRMNHWTLFTGGQEFEYAQGATIYSTQWGSIQHFDLTIERLDRENMLMDVHFTVQATSLNNGQTSINYEGFLSDLPLTAELDS